MPTRLSTAHRSATPQSARTAKPCRTWYPATAELREHPLMPYQDRRPRSKGVQEPWLPTSRLALSYRPEKKLEIFGREVEATTSHDVRSPWQRVQPPLRYLNASTTLATRAPAVPIADRSGSWPVRWRSSCRGTAAALHALVAGIWYHREGDGSFSVHPAVRDHFHQLAAHSGGGAWHDLLREQLVSLVQRLVSSCRRRARSGPGRGSGLHALQAKEPSRPCLLYNHVLGGLRHLGWKLGEMARGLRISGIPPCPEPWTWPGICGHSANWTRPMRQRLAFFRADIRLLQGRLPEVRTGGTAHAQRRGVPHGADHRLAPDVLACTISARSVAALPRRPPPNAASALLEGFYHDIGWKAIGPTIVAAGGGCTPAG